MILYKETFRTNIYFFDIIVNKE